MIIQSFNKNLKPAHALGWALLLFGFAFHSILYAQTKNFPFQHLTIEDGLSQNSINCIMQDKQGFLWFGTQDGLNRYDGYRFKVYKYDPDDNTSIPSSNWVETLAVDGKGRLWVGTRNGLCLFNRDKDNFIRFDFSKEAVPHNRIESLETDMEGNVWVGSDKGLSKIITDTDNPTFVHISSDTRIPPLKGMHISDIYEMPNRDIWVGTVQNGLILIKNGDFATADYIHLTDSASNGQIALSNKKITAIWHDNKNRLWVGTEFGLNLVDIPKNKVQYFFFSPDNPKGIPDNRIAGGFQDSNGNLWVGTYFKGACIYDELSGDFKLLQNKSTDPKSLSDNNIVKTFFEDRTGITWIGTLLGGVNKYDPNQVKFKHYKPIEGVESLNDRIIRGFYKDHKGILWVCTQNGGLNGLNTLTGEWIHITHDPKNPQNTIPNNYVKAVVRDSLGVLWVGLRKDGVARIDLQANGKHKVTRFIANEDGFASNEISSIFMVGKDVWVLDYTGALCVYDSNNKKFIRRSPKLFENNRRGLCAFADNWGRIWVGGYQTIFCYDIDANKSTQYQYDESQAEQFPAANIKSIYMLEKDWMWLGTSIGLVKWSPENGTIKRYSTDDGMPNNMAYAALPDTYGNIWMSTNNGVSMLDVATDNFKNYDMSDGLQSSEFNTGAYYRAADGQILLGGINGFNAFYPDEISENAYIPQVALTDFRLFSKEVPIRSEENPNSPLKKSISETKEINLSYTDYVVLFEFAALHYSSPQKNHYAYMLEPFDPEWNYTDASRRAITYTNLPHGSYKFKVKASNNDGVWNEEGLSIIVTVSPPWYKIWWIQAGSLLLLVIVVYGAYRSRINREKQRATLLEQTVQERTKEIQEKNVELEQQQEEIIAQRDNLEHSYQNVRIMSDIGRQVTAQLDMKTMLNTLYKNVNELFDATGFGVGTIQGDYIVFKNFIEKGEALPDFSVHKYAKDKLPAWCVQKRDVVWMNDLQKDYHKYLKGVTPQSLEGDLPESLIYIPLTIEHRIIGVMTIQSFNKNAYTDYHLDLLKNLANFIAIALDNAHNYSDLQDVKLDVEQKNRSMLDSIRYAKTIQQAILPPPEEITQRLPEHFILYMPKDIVSGDFYWFAEKDDKVYVAVVDCTGHGVPGAFMSMIGHTLLNEVLFKIAADNVSCGEILAELNKEVKIALRQDTEQNTDGMDVVLCEIDTKAEKLSFAGAKRPLWVVYDGELSEIKGDRKSIGGYHKQALVNFQTAQVEYRSGAMVYLTSDGYPDQHNPDGKKIGSRDLKELISSVASKDAKEQLSALQKYLSKHQKNMPQRDDIAIIGIRLP